MTRNSSCPRCGSASIPIVYGLPSGELFEAADRVEVALGGCEIQEATRRCVGVDCGLEFTPVGRVRSVNDLAGIIPYDGPPLSLEEIDEAIAEAAAKRYENL